MVHSISKLPLVLLVIVMITSACFGGGSSGNTDAVDPGDNHNPVQQV